MQKLEHKENIKIIQLERTPLDFGFDDRLKGVKSRPHSWTRVNLAGNSARPCAEKYVNFTSDTVTHPINQGTILKGIEEFRNNIFLKLRFICNTLLIKVRFCKKILMFLS